jgi:fructose-bisphosphate aldolase class II
VPGHGVTEEIWAKMAAYAKEKGWKKGDYKKLNLPFENILLGQPREVRERMAQGVEDFTYHLLVEVFNAKDTAPLAIEAILRADSHDLGPKCAPIEDPKEWTPAKIAAKARLLTGDKGPAGDFSD